ncbi:hypothetical protein ACS0TY_028933 [Phlomoides rotata]
MAPRKKPKVDRDDHEPKVNRDDHEPKVDREDHDHEPRVGDDTVTHGLDDTMTYSKRGRTNMYCLYKDRATGVIKDVDFDKLGRPIGENGTKLQSYIGVLVREKVKITYPTWKHVPKDIKEQIWKQYSDYLGRDTQTHACFKDVVADRFRRALLTFDLRVNRSYHEDQYQ